MADLIVKEHQDKEKADIDEKANKARERELTKEIRDIDNDIEEAQTKEDKARATKNEIEQQQDENNAKIQELEKENAEIDKALENTDIDEDVAEMKATKQKNIEQIKNLKKNNKALENQRKKAIKDIESAIAEQEKLGQTRDSLDHERSQLSENIIDENGKVDMTVKQYKNQRLGALKRTMKAISNALKTGARLTRREIRDK